MQCSWTRKDVANLLIDIVVLVKITAAMVANLNSALVPAAPSIDVNICAVHMCARCRCKYYHFLATQYSMSVLRIRIHRVFEYPAGGVWWKVRPGFTS